MRVTSSNSSPTVLAGNITNQLVFTAEDFKGKVLTNSQNNRVIRMVLEFYQKEYSLAQTGSNSNNGMYFGSFLRIANWFIYADPFPASNWLVRFLHHCRRPGSELRNPLQ